MVSASLTSSCSADSFGRSCVRDEDLRLVQRVADEVGGQRRQDADGEHAAPADHRQQDRREDGRGENAKLPAEPDIGRGAGPHGGRPCLGNQRHADAEFAAEAEAGDGAVGQQIVVALRQRAEPGEYGEQDDGLGQHADAADAVGQHAEEDAADHGADQRGGDQRSALGRGQVQIGEISRSMKPRMSRSNPSMA